MATFIPHTIRIHLPNALQVSIVGDFNNWHSNAHPLVQVGPDLWERLVDLPPGKHRYAFFVLHDSDDRDLRSRIIGNGSVLWVPESEEQAISITAHPELAMADTRAVA